MSFLGVSRSTTPTRDDFAIDTFSTNVIFECERTVIDRNGLSRPPSSLQPDRAGKHPSAPSLGGQPGEAIDWGLQQSKDRLPIPPPL